MTRVLPLTLLSFLLMAAPAFAAPAFAQGDNGEGLLGEVDDKLVTFFSLGVGAFFVVVVILGTIIQSRLERRKDEAKKARLKQRTGW